MEFHELSNVFPMMGEAEYQSLKSSIADVGLIEPIWTFQGKIIDGRNRYKACEELGIKPEFREWKGNKNSLIFFVVSENVQRRHLTTSQRAALAVEILPKLEKEAIKRQIEAGRSGRVRIDTLAQKIAEGGGESREIAADIFQTNRNYVSKAKVLNIQARDLLADVKNGKYTILQAINELEKRNQNKIDETHPIPKELAIDAIGFAALTDAMRCAAGGNNTERDWLMGDDNEEFTAEKYCEDLGIDYSVITNWGSAGFDNRPFVEILIDLLKKQFEKAELEIER